jgi:chemotaxis protein methyltransferase CheR
MYHGLIKKGDIMINITDSEFRKLAGYMKSNYGINLTEKRVLIEGRLSNIIIDKGFNSYSDYLEFVFQDSSGVELEMLINKLTTNHTFFMREAEHFQYFRNVVLPYLKCVDKARDLRIWSAGCSSGEEPYTLAMIIADYFGEEKIVGTLRY